MAQIVHVIKPSGTSFQYVFSDLVTPEQILRELEGIKGHFGFNGTVKKRDPKLPSTAPLVDYADPTSGFVFDHPDCAVVLFKTQGHEVALDDQGKPIVAKVLKGAFPKNEPAPEPEPTS